MTPAQLLKSSRERRGLSIRLLAEAAGVSASTIHRIEKCEMEPTVEMLQKLLETLGLNLHIEGEPDYASSLVGLFDSIFGELEAGDDRDALRKTSELVARYRLADTERQHRMIAVEPESTMNDRWDAFAGALGEWLAVTSDVAAPSWTHAADRYLHEAWWVTSKKSLRAWEYAGTPASFQDHGVYIHRESLVNV